MWLPESATRAFDDRLLRLRRDRLHARGALGGEQQREPRLRRRERRGLRAQRAAQAVLGLGFLVLRLTQREERHHARGQGRDRKQRERAEREAADAPAPGFGGGGRRFLGVARRDARVEERR